MKVLIALLLFMCFVSLNSINHRMATVEKAVKTIAENQLLLNQSKE